VAVKFAVDPAMSTSTVSNDSSRIDGVPSGIPEVVEIAVPVEDAQRGARSWRVSFGEAEDGAAEQHPFGCQDIGDVPDRHGLVRLRSAQAVEHITESGRVERTIDREGLHHVRLHRDRVHRRQRAGSVCEHVRVRIEQGDLGSVGRCGLLQEVARARTDVEVPAPHESAIALDDGRDRAPPDRTSHEAEHPWVVDLQEQWGVARLFLVGGIARSIKQTRPGSSCEHRAAVRADELAHEEVPFVGRQHHGGLGHLLHCPQALGQDLGLLRDPLG
jgi:hypothetical protein